MPFALALVAFAGPAIFDQSLAAFRARKAFSVGISYVAAIGKSVQEGRYSLSFQPPGKVLLTKLVGGKPSLTFWLNGAKLVAYDPEAAEMTVRKTMTSGPITSRLANALGGLDDPVSAQLSPSAMAALFSPFRKLGGWASSRSGSLIVLTRASTFKGGKTLTQFEFAASSKLLTRALLAGPDSRMEWKYAYGPAPTRLAFNPKPGTRTVDVLSEHVRAVNADPESRPIVDACLRAYARLASVAFTVSRDAGSAKVWASGGNFRERTESMDWSYAKGVLTVSDLARHRAYRGSCRVSEAISALKKLDAPVEPTLLAMMTRKNPVASWFLPTMYARSHGLVVEGGVRADAILLTSEEIDVSLLVRRDNHLVASVTSRVKNRGGQVVSEASRDFAYTSVNKPLPASTFSVKVENPLPLGALGKLP